MLYKCIKNFATIKVGEFAVVEFDYTTLHNQICVTANRHAYFINSLTLKSHFEKMDT